MNANDAEKGSTYQLPDGSVGTFLSVVVTPVDTLYSFSTGQGKPHLLNASDVIVPTASPAEGRIRVAFDALARAHSGGTAEDRRAAVHAAGEVLESIHPGLPHSPTREWLELHSFTGVVRRRLLAEAPEGHGGAP